MAEIKKQLFEKQPKDLTTSAHFTIRRSLLKKINNDSKEFGISASKVVDTIIADYYNSIKK